MTMSQRVAMNPKRSNTSIVYPFFLSIFAGKEASARRRCRASRARGHPLCIFPETFELSLPETVVYVM